MFEQKEGVGCGPQNFKGVKERRRGNAWGPSCPSSRPRLAVCTSLILPGILSVPLIIPYDHQLAQCPGFLSAAITVLPAFVWVFDLQSDFPIRLQAN